MPFYTYILFSEKLDGYYIGYTSLLPEERLRMHLISKSGHTSKAKDWNIVYKESFYTKSEAMLRERQLKGWKSKVRIKELIDRS